VAVYTHVSSEEIASFLKRFDVGDLRMAKGIAEGVENSNYLIETTRGRFILTLYEKRVKAGDLPYFLKLTSHLSHAGLPVPKAIADADGQQLHELQGRPACLIEFFSGISVTEPTPAHCLAVGQSLAQLHLAGADFPMTRPNDQSVATWQRLAAELTKKLDEIEPGLEDFVSSTLKYLLDQFPDDLPAGAIHADLFPDNVLFTGTKITGLIDFYFACTDFYAYDLAILWNSWAFSNDGRIYYQDRAAALQDGYQSVRPLAGQEHCSFNILCQAAAMRFLLTRAYDWINTPATALVTRKDPLAYKRRIAHLIDGKGGW
jgi:homoserine kinase type II